MAKYRVYLSESVSYVVEVEAEDRYEAEEMATEKLCGAGQPDDYFDESTGFEVDAVRKLKIKAKELVAA
ncbi:hypothetical protein ACH4YO_08040 [Streptomyces noursei]|uniref:hypothetical protein n=1 Tax=Streptomyces noursei TaxID=1971 RepID=UPI0033CF1941